MVEKKESMRKSMHKALDMRIDELKKHGFDLDKTTNGNLISIIETEQNGKILKISLSYNRKLRMVSLIKSICKAQRCYAS